MESITQNKLLVCSIFGSIVYIFALACGFLPDIAETFEIVDFPEQVKIRVGTFNSNWFVTLLILNYKHVFFNFAVPTETSVGISVELRFGARSRPVMSMAFRRGEAPKAVILRINVTKKIISIRVSRRSKCIKIFWSIGTWTSSNVFPIVTRVDRMNCPKNFESLETDRTSWLISFIATEKL